MTETMDIEEVALSFNAYQDSDYCRVQLVTDSGVVLAEGRAHRDPRDEPDSVHGRALAMSRCLRNFLKVLDGELAEMSQRQESLAARKHKPTHEERHQRWLDSQRERPTDPIDNFWDGVIRAQVS